MPDLKEENFKIVFRHWAGTAAVAVLAGFIIFGLLRGQEVLNRFLKKQDSVDANLEKGELLEQVQIEESDVSLTETPSPKPTVVLQTKLFQSPTPAAIQPINPSITPTATPIPTLIPTYTSTPIPSSILTPTPTSIPMPEPTPTPSPSPTPSSGAVVINEIAWMGTEANSADEWIELYNPNSSAVDISGWNLKSFSDGKPDIIFSDGSIISAFGYFLIERTDDNTISNIFADLKIGFGYGVGSGLSNSGEILKLYDGQGNLKDVVGHNDETGQVAAWYAGHNISRSSMERIDYSKLGTDPSNWQTNNGIVKNDLDADGKPVNGTPRQQNSSQTN